MRLLVIEDDRKVASFLERGLREDGYAVDVAPDGETGSQSARLHEYDALIVDVMLPRKNGLDVVREVRAAGRSVPILLLTARDDYFEGRPRLAGILYRVIPEDLTAVLVTLGVELPVPAAANEAVMKMAEVPEGSEVVEFATNNFPHVVFRNIYIFPGIPRYLQEKFNLIKERFRTSDFYLKKVYLRAMESDIAATLNTVVGRNDCVTFGSYPLLGNPEYQIILTVESKLKPDLEKALEDLLAQLPKGILVRVE